MATKQTLIEDDDVVLYFQASREALHSAILNLYEIGKQRIGMADAQVIDAETGEVRDVMWRLVFGVDRVPLTIKQRGFLHAAVFPQMAEQIRVPIYNDKGEHIDTIRYIAAIWKEFCRAMFLGEKWVKEAVPFSFTKTGKQVYKRVKVRVSTEDLTIKGYSEHIDRCIAYASTEHGVNFVFDEKEREAVRYRKPQRKTKPKDHDETSI